MAHSKLFVFLIFVVTESFCAQENPVFNASLFRFGRMFEFAFLTISVDEIQHKDRMLFEKSERNGALAHQLLRPDIYDYYDFSCTTFSQVQKQVKKNKCQLAVIALLDAGHFQEHVGVVVYSDNTVMGHRDLCIFSMRKDEDVWLSRDIEWGNLEQRRKKTADMLIPENPSVFTREFIEQQFVHFLKQHNSNFSLDKELDRQEQLVDKICGVSGVLFNSSPLSLKSQSTRDSGIGPSFSKESHQADSLPDSLYDHIATIIETPSTT